MFNAYCGLILPSLIFNSLGMGIYICNLKPKQNT